MESVCFSFHVCLLIITLLSLKLHTENNTCTFLLKIVGGSEKSQLFAGGSEKPVEYFCQMDLIILSCTVSKLVRF